MQKKIIIGFTVVVLLSGCVQARFEGQTDTPIEKLQISDPIINEYEREQLISFLYEAEKMMQKPIEEATINEGEIKIFSEQFKTKNDLFEYYQTYLSNELANTMSRKVSDISRSRDHQFVAVSIDDIDWLSINDANENSIKVVLHTTVQSVVEMDLKNESNIRLQYTIMKNKLGENKKIVQKTILYN